jgi:hypothetical protein
VVVIPFLLEVSFGIRLVEKDTFTGELSENSSPVNNGVTGVTLR